MRKGKPYSFNYSVQDERTGVLHSRDEARDETGHVKGNYEVGTRNIFYFFLPLMCICNNFSYFVHILNDSIDATLFKK